MRAKKIPHEDARGLAVAYHAYLEARAVVQRVRDAGGCPSSEQLNSVVVWADSLARAEDATGIDLMGALRLRQVRDTVRSERDAAIAAGI